MDIKDMTKDQILSVGIGRILKQGGPAMDRNGDCVYYDAKTGNKCGVGVLYEDETVKKLQSDYGGSPVEKIKTTDLGTKHMKELKLLQNAHDDSVVSGFKVLTWLQNYLAQIGRLEEEVKAGQGDA